MQVEPTVRLTGAPTVVVWFDGAVMVGGASTVQAKVVVVAVEPAVSRMVMVVLVVPAVVGVPLMVAPVMVNPAGSAPAV